MLKHLIVATWKSICISYSVSRLCESSVMCGRKSGRINKGLGMINWWTLTRRLKIDGIPNFL